MTTAPFACPELADALDVCEQLGLHIRDVGAPASAVDRPTQVIWGHGAYRGIQAKGAALLDAINHSHPLLDGNTRLSILLVMLLYRLNGLSLVVGPEEGDESRQVRATARSASARLRRRRCPAGSARVWSAAQVGGGPSCGGRSSLVRSGALPVAARRSRARWWSRSVMARS